MALRFADVECATSAPRSAFRSATTRRQVKRALPASLSQTAPLGMRRLASWKMMPSVWRCPCDDLADAVAHGSRGRRRACRAPAGVARRTPRRRPAQRHDLGARLHARPLLGQHELAAAEVARRARRAAPPPAAGRRARRTGPGAGSCSRRRRSCSSSGVGRVWPASWQRREELGVLAPGSARRCPCASCQRLAIGRERADRAPSRRPLRPAAAGDRRSSGTRRARSRAAPSRRGCESARSSA